MISTGIGLLLLSLVTGDALVICGGDLAHINTETGTVTQSVGVLHTYPNDVVIHDGFAFVVNSGDDTGTLQRFELNNWSLTELGIGTGWNCWGSLPLENGSLAVTASLNNSITMINPQEMTIGNTISGIGPNPEWMAEYNGKLYTACGGWGTGNSIVVLDIGSGSVTDTLTAGTNCQSLLFSDDGILFALCSGTYGNNDGHVVVINPETSTAIDTLVLGGFPAFCTAANGIFYTADPWGAGVFSIDMQNLTVTHDMNNPFSAGGNGLATDDQGFLWITDSINNAVRVYDTEENLVNTYSLTNPGPIAVTGSFTGIEGEIHTVTPAINVSPNPAVSLITVTGTQPGTTVLIFDVTGRVAAEGVASGSGTTSLSIQNLSPGLYTAVSGESAARFAVIAK